MTQYSGATNNAQARNAHPDWTSFIATAMFEGGQAFLKTISGASPTMDEAQLQADERQVDQRLAQAFDAAKRDRAHPGPHLLTAVRNWSRKQAIAIPREKVAGKQIRQDFYQPFQYDLQQEISTMILDLQLFWEQEDERRALAKRKEAEQAFDAAYPVVRGLSDAVLDGERVRRAIFESGQQMARDWANNYEESVKTRERRLEERETREYQLALRSLARWDDRASFANTLVSTGKNTLGCLFLWFVLVAGILVAIYFAFPHH